MAEAVVAFVVERLGDLLIQEAIFLYGVREKVEQMQAELKRMKFFLRDADSKLLQEGDESVRNWIAEIREGAFDAEDVIDKFILKVVSNRRGGFRGALKRYACTVFTQSIDLYMVGKEIEEIRNRIRDISLSRETYGIAIKNNCEGEGSETQRHLRRRSYPHVDEEDIVGLEKDIEALVAELIKEEEERLHVVSITGMGGLGKTTLAKKIYNHNVVKRHFDCYSWAFISEQCRTRDVLQEILRKFGISVNHDMKVEELVEKLYHFLEDKRYLVVLDDIWSTEDWDILKPAFPNGKMGSKVMITTRNREVALHADARGFLHEPRHLTEEQSWELLCKKAFPENTSTSCPPILEKVGREMVAKCGGLPLAIVVLGGLLATKLALNEWEMVQNSINSYWTKSQDGVVGILSLSYDDLPYHLKPCFLYLGLFPEDFEIPKTKLIQLWAAEGFIRQEGEDTVEDLGEQHFAELIHRCMVQIGKRSVTGRVKSCRVHDLMRELCISKARQENFFEIFHFMNLAVDSSIVPSANKVRRHAIHSGNQRYASIERPTPCLRTILFISADKLSLESVKFKFIYQSFKLLRVLDLKSVYINKNSIPRQIGRLIHLRYFGLRNTNIEELPGSIGNLQSLQTLELRGCNVHNMPNVIWKMKQLRHLYMGNDCHSYNLQMNTLRNLRTLHWIKAGSWIEEESLASLTNLQNWGISHVSRSLMEVVLASIVVRSDCLRSLSLTTFETFPDLEPLSRCRHLLTLNLTGCMEKLLQWPRNLTKLSLLETRLQQDPMATLHNLPNLMFLRLSWFSYLGKEMVCPAKGFQQLQVLKLQYMPELEEWRVDEGAIPILKRLEIKRCRNLRMVPEGLSFVTTLQELEIKLMPMEFKDRVREGGEDWYKVQNIPSIEIL